MSPSLLQTLWANLMAITRIKPKDYQTIASWYHAHKLTPPAWQDLSETGWIADNRVAGWLLCTNSSVAIIEHLISNPETVPSLRKESIEKLAGFMIDTALLLGYSNIIAASKHPSVDKVARRFGFKKTDLSFYLLSEQDSDENNSTSYLMDNALDMDDE